ncbi:MAG: hydrogenase maturation nickel metallochaperone HypA [Acidimicrobiales bacterium]
MHELSLCRAIADTAIDHAGGRPIERIQLRIGHFRQVVPETLQHCWQVRSETTDLAGCELDVEYVPGRIRCNDCEQMTTLDLPVLRCGTCEGTDVTMTAGDEFLIVSIDVTKDNSPEEAY